MTAVSTKIEWLDGRVVGVVASVPSQRLANADMRLPAEAEEAAKVTGVRSRRWADSETTEDLCLAAAKRLMERLSWEPGEVDCLVYVTQTPSAEVPSPGYAVHASLGLTSHCPVIEVNWSCAGYVYGLWLAHVLASSNGVNKRVLLLVGDTTSKIVDVNDRATGPLFGDAGSATAVETVPGRPLRTKFVLGTDGSGFSRLTQEGPWLRMDGGAVFNFTLKTVPKLVDEVTSGQAPDHLLFHQANEFMLGHLAKKMDLVGRFGEGKTPTNVSEYGNCSSASIPLLLCDKLGMEARGKKVAVLGYGAGWSWAGAMLDLSGLRCADLMEVTA